MLPIILSRNVRYWRKHYGMTQAELAKAIGVNTTFVSRIERGEKLISIKVLKAMVDLFGISYDSLLREPEPDIRVKNIDFILKDCSDEYVRHIESIVMACHQLPARR